MSIYAISDLHLALSMDKPMDIFGERWENYMEKLRIMWEQTVTSDDYVIVPGDISWATYLEQAVEDFKFIDSLPGKKIISKGNHDYWWTTMSKLEGFIYRNNFSTISFMHNNSFRIENVTLCGTRGWNSPGDNGFTADDNKIYNRELQRLELSLKSSIEKGGDIIIAALHYPPFNSKGEPTEFVNIMGRYGVKICVYGHLHGESIKSAFNGEMDGIEYRLVSADFLDFKPLLLNTMI
ncbi:MAG TPA: serine/threonine protein phosphatase [Clostridiaceae bacterium]|nr:serine/threonine protein phosphatase [Clostridiaceae bacterium]